MPTKRGLYGYVAEFETPTALVQAAERARAEGYTRMDAYSPFPVEGLAEGLGSKKTLMPLVILIGGICGLIGGYFLQYYTMSIDYPPSSGEGTSRLWPSFMPTSLQPYPMNVGGRPLHSWPSFIPVTFECTVLIASLSAVFGLLALCGLPMPYHPLFNVPRFALASRSRFFLCIEAADPRFDKERTRQLLDGLQPLEVSEVPW
jgi:hypothetical protein